jgi:hypothetical protein
MLHAAFTDSKYAMAPAKKKKRPTTTRDVHKQERLLLLALDLMRLAIELLPGTPHDFERFARDYREVRRQLTIRIARCKRLPVNKATTRLVRSLKNLEREYAELEARARTYQMGATTRLRH